MVVQIPHGATEAQIKLAFKKVLAEQLTQDQVFKLMFYGDLAVRKMVNEIEEKLPGLLSP